MFSSKGQGPPPTFLGVKGCGKGKAPAAWGSEEEDRSRDWYCPKCRERNFVKRAECFKCRTPKPKEGDLTAPPRPVAPANGTTLNGMVKSYNRKGFGFLMCLGTDYGQDIYYTRENLSPKLQTRDIPGQHVTFEIHRFPDGKLTALNIRPLGDDKDEPKGKAVGKGSCQAFGCFGKDEEDRSRDWSCAGCGERNFMKRFECFKCKTPRASGFTDAPSGTHSVAPTPMPPQRALSPHAGSRAVREMLAAKGRSRSRSRGGKKRKKERERIKRRRRSSRSRSSGSGNSRSRSSHSRRKKDGKRPKKSRRSRGRSSSSSKPRKTAGSRSRRSRSSGSSKSSDCKMEEPSASAAGPSGGGGQVLRSGGGGGGGDPSVDAAKAEALEELLKLRAVEPKEARMTEWRALLRKWHPDKNPDRVEVATAVFQFLQRGKAILDDR